MQFVYVAAFLIGTATLSLFLHYSVQARVFTAADVRVGGKGVPAAFAKSYPICRPRGSHAS
jgi:hypothetical protein